MWSVDGATLYYNSGRDLMAVDVALGEDLSLSLPRTALTRAREVSIVSDVTSDGRFLARFREIEEEDGDLGRDSVAYRLNWIQELERLVPVER